MMKERTGFLRLAGVTQIGPQGPLWQHTCPLRQSEDLEHFVLWQAADCGLAGVGHGDTSVKETALPTYRPVTRC
jgi:hypothetical protein